MVVVMPKIKSGKKSFPIILRLGIILSVLRKKKISFYERNLKIMKNNTVNNVFCDRIFLHYRFFLIFKKLLDFYELWLIFLKETYFYKHNYICRFFTYFQNWK